MSKQCTRIYKLLSNITHRANYTYTPCTNIKSTTAIYEIRNITAAREIGFRMFYKEMGKILSRGSRAYTRR